MTEPQLKRRYPAGTLSQLLLLSLLIGLVLATWLRTKATIETPTPKPSVTLCDDAPLAAITTSRRVWVIDCLTGATRLSVGPGDLRALGGNSLPAVSNSDWYRWPGSSRNGASDGTTFTPNLDIDFRQGFFGSGVPSDNALMFWEWERGRNSMPRCLFTRGGAAIAMEATHFKDAAFDYLIVDLASGKRTEFRRAFRTSDLADQPSIMGEYVVLPATKGEDYKIIDPATGFVDGPIEAQIRRRSKKDPGFPLAAVDEFGANLEIASRYDSSGMSLLIRAKSDDPVAANRWRLLASWLSSPSISWQSLRSALIVHDLIEESNVHAPYESSPVWRLQDRPPFLRRISWPFREQEAFHELRVTEDLLGATGTCDQIDEKSLLVASQPVYWDFEAARVTPIPNRTVRTKRFGDQLIVETPTHLHTVHLPTGRIAQSIAIDRESRPPIVIAWAVWLAAWGFFARRTREGDYSRLLGFLTAGAFLGLMVSAKWQGEGDVLWLLQSLVLVALTVAFITSAIRRAASIATLLVCGALICGLVASVGSFGFEQKNYFQSKGVVETRSKAVWARMTERPSSSSARTIDSILSPWLPPRAVDLPAPKWIPADEVKPK